MNCPKIRQQLDDYLDDELSVQVTEQIRQHLENCPACRNEYLGLRALVQRAAEMEQQIQPSRELWPGILARIDKGSSARNTWWLQLAAAGIALAVLTVPLSVWWSGHQDSAISTSDRVALVDDRLTDQAAMARSEDGVLLARTDLVTAIEKQRDVIEDDTLQVLEDNMILLDRAIGELRTALDEDPQNLRLRMLLASRYQQERKLLQKVSRV